MTLLQANCGRLHALRQKLTRQICEAFALRRAGVVCVSFPGSGQTWLRAVLSRFYQIRYGLPTGTLLGIEHFHRLNPEIPRILFTHDGGAWRRPDQLRADKSKYADKKVVLLVRHPIDVVVSQYAYLRRHDANLHQPARSRLPLDAFVWTPFGGLPTIVAFLNDWYHVRSRLSQLLVVRYEDVWANPGVVLQQLADFLAIDNCQAAIAGSVREVDGKQACYGEAQGVFDTIHLPARAGETDAANLCRGEKAAYRRLFSHHDVIRLEAFIRAQLPSAYGYVPAMPQAEEDKCPPSL